MLQMFLFKYTDLCSLLSAHPECQQHLKWTNFLKDLSSFWWKDQTNDFVLNIL